MARFDTTGLDTLVERMIEAGEYANGQLANDMLNAAAAQVQSAWRQAATIHNHVFSGAMYESIGFSTTPENVGGVQFIDIYPQGDDPITGVRNMEKAAWAHYGWHNTAKAIKRRKGRQVKKQKSGSHWIDDADRICGETVIPAMQRVYNEYLETKG